MRIVSTKAFLTADVFLARGVSSASRHLTRATSETSRVQPTGQGSVVAAPPRSAYVHLPFCKRRCYYCDFPIQVLGEQPAESANSAVTQYIQLLCEEIRKTPREGEGALETVFFGGGTPSLVPPCELERVVEALRRQFGFEATLEMSLEADPGTFDVAKLRQFAALGVNRVSVGVQSFDDATLKRCGRSHSAAEVQRALADVKEARPPSWSLDLISGLPHVDLDAWKRTLAAAIASGPDHVAVYDLQVESSTPFARWYVPEVAPLPSHELSAEMYCLASRMFREAGYEHYEVSNYAKSGHRCRHNMAYWKNESFYGFGLGATSNVRGRRIARPKKMKKYSEWVSQMHDAQEGQDAEDVKDSALDSVMLSLRLRDGIHLASFAAAWGDDVVTRLKRSVVEYCGQGLVECVAEDGVLLEWKGNWDGVARLRLADPSGFLISNSILTTIFSAF